MLQLAPRADVAGRSNRYEFFEAWADLSIQCGFQTRSEAAYGFVPGHIVLMSLRPAIPWRVGLHQSPPPLYQPVSIFGPLAKTVNHHPAGAGEFSTGEMRNFHPALTFDGSGAN